MGDKASQSERNLELERFAHCMLASGYGQSIRKDILEGARQHDQELRQGERYRSREVIRLAKQENLSRHVNS